MRQQSSMTNKSDNIYLIHILDSIIKTETYLQDIEKDVYQKDTLIQDGCN